MKKRSRRVTPAVVQKSYPFRCWRSEWPCDVTVARGNGGVSGGGGGRRCWRSGATSRVEPGRLGGGGGAVKVD